MRHIGVDLHKTNFVVCFLAADDTQTHRDLPAHQRRARPLQAATQNGGRSGGRGHAERPLLLRPGEGARQPRRGRGHLPLRGHRQVEEEDGQGGRLGAGPLPQAGTGCPKCRCLPSRSGRCASCSKPERRWSRCGRSSRTWRTPRSPVTAWR